MDTLKGVDKTLKDDEWQNPSVDITPVGEVTSKLTPLPMTPGTPALLVLEMSTDEEGNTPGQGAARARAREALASHNLSLIHI